MLHKSQLISLTIIADDMLIKASRGLSCNHHHVPKQRLKIQVILGLSDILFVVFEFLKVRVRGWKNLLV